MLFDYHFFFLCVQVKLELLLLFFILFMSIIFIFQDQVCVSLKTVFIQYIVAH